MLAKILLMKIMIIRISLEKRNEKLNRREKELVGKLVYQVYRRATLMYQGYSRGTWSLDIYVLASTSRLHNLIVQHGYQSHL